MSEPYSVTGHSRQCASEPLIMPSLCLECLPFILCFASSPSSLMPTSNPTPNAISFLFLSSRISFSLPYVLIALSLPLVISGYYGRWWWIVYSSPTINCEFTEGDFRSFPSFPTSDPSRGPSTLFLKQIPICTIVFVSTATTWDQASVSSHPDAAMASYMASLFSSLPPTLHSPHAWQQSLKAS